MQGPHGCRVAGQPCDGLRTLSDSLTLPDVDDRHVLAAAIVGRCDVIVTQNLKHFPETVLAPYSVEAIHPDEFLCKQLSAAPGAFCDGVRKVRARLRKPAYAVEEYLETLARQGLVETAKELRVFVDLL